MLPPMSINLCFQIILASRYGLRNNSQSMMIRVPKHFWRRKFTDQRTKAGSFENGKEVLFKI